MNATDRTARYLGRPPTTVRLLDVVGATAALAITAPLWPAIALAVKLESRGPVFHRGARLGAGEQVFGMRKFRSMRPGLEHRAAITVAGDSRITRVGRLLRATKLDELPQLLHVLRGDMSLVGPRPEAPDYLDGYPSELREIFCHRPGITSPASLEYRHEEALLAAAADPQRFYVDEVLPAKARIDLDYCRRRTARSDLRVLALTFRSVARLRA